ncbi:hypothetical protein RRF57_007202 [Xylaria bambusicola]|uniref:Uncharacterized protein n=1 Tax=Xylaria bambusicola TaxID=326684 RepID=A0AAN7URM9_9PEZI
MSLSGRSLAMLLEAVVAKLSYLKVLFDAEERVLDGGKECNYELRDLEVKPIHHSELGEEQLCTELKEALRSLVHPHLDILFMPRFNEQRMTTHQCDVYQEIMARLPMKERQDTIWERLAPRCLGGFGDTDHRSMEQLVEMIPRHYVTVPTLEKLLEQAKHCSILAAATGESASEAEDHPPEHRYDRDEYEARRVAMIYRDPRLPVWIGGEEGWRYPQLD